jgi:CrcB protein
VRNLLLVGAGGFIGSVLRYLLGGWVQSMVEPSKFPLGTLMVNALGCLVMGVVGGIAESRELLSAEVRLFLMVGLLGGFTTFSAFGNETLLLWHDAPPMTALLNITPHLLLGLGAVWLGYMLARMG